MSDWDENEWYRRVTPLIDVIIENDQEEYLDEYDIGEEVANRQVLSASYILYCNRKGLKQKNKILKAWVSSKLKFISR